MYELTFGLIKSGALKRGQAEAIFSRIKEEGDIRVAVNGLEPAQLKSCLIKLYDEHKGRMYYDNLIASVVEPLAMPFCLGGENVVARWRELMGATNPERAAKGTIRAMFGRELPDNAVHGSNSVERAEVELNLFGFYPPLLRTMFAPPKPSRVDLPVAAEVSE